MTAFMGSDIGCDAEGAHSERTWAAIENARTKRGWRDATKQDSDFAVYEPKSIEHRYFSVQHDTI